MTLSVVERMFGLIDGQQWDALEEVFADEVVYQRPGYLPLCGREAVEHFYREVRIIATGAHRLEMVICETNRAACWGRFTGLSRKGEAIDIEFADAYQLSDGKIIARKSFFYVPGV